MKTRFFDRFIPFIQPEFFYWVGISFFSTFFLLTGQAEEPKEPKRLFIGTYTGENGSQGIYTCQFDSIKGVFTKPELAAKCEHPSFLAIHPSRPLLYAVLEERSQSALYVFTYQKSTGKLTLLDEKEIPGRSSCHLCLCRTQDSDSDSEFPAESVVVANYTSGNIVSFPILADGKIGNLATNYQHTGSGVNSVRQKTPHPHAVYFDAESKTIAVPDLGIDRVLYYDIDTKTAKLTPKPIPKPTPKENQLSLVLPSGGGPRHLAVSKDKRFTYVNNELSSTVCVFEMGGRTLIQEISTLPEGVIVSNNSTAEIEISSSGRFLYVSNRGDDSIAVFSVEPQNGWISRIQNISSGGKHPRFFALDPTGCFLLSCNMETNNIEVLGVHPETGILTPTQSRINIFRPVCIVFAP
ncbi:MAG: lactonase family protein [Planctomycetaceae bacterium]|nr:lactonase family protein [Planctomycetaceae bacterium]